MSKRKSPIHVVPSFTYAFTRRDGSEGERTLSTRVNGAMKLHDGGSVFLGIMTLVLGIETPFGESIVSLDGVVARIMVDGTLTLEPKHRKDSYFDDKGEERPGGFVFELGSAETRNALAQVAATFPPLAKRIKSARAALEKRSATA